MVISVTQLNNYVHGLFEMDSVLNDVSVAGEITNLKRASNGWYFSLKDNDAAIDCFCYLNTSEPQTGMLVVAEGKINFWVKSGRISFFVRRLTQSKNTGAAYLKFLELKEKLQKEGLFDEARKKPIPRCCLNIGVVTSATGAVIHDIENVVHRRQPFSNIILYPVKVQGAGADVEIAQGVAYFANSDVDAVIVGRGGGSNEDLSAFNSELVVRAVADCPKPIVSAVGHGVDFSLCDFAADRRAVTPSEAAEFVTMDGQKAKSDVKLRLARLSTTLQNRLSGTKTRTLLSLKRISSTISSEVQRSTNRVRLVLSQQDAQLQRLVSERTNRLQALSARISAANPMNVLTRGFAYVSKQDQKIFSARQVNVGDQLNVKLADGEVQATATKVTL